MKVSELREKSIDELQALSASLRRDKFKISLNKAEGEQNNTAQIGQIRKQIARVETLLREKSN